MRGHRGIGAERAAVHETPAAIEAERVALLIARLETKDAVTRGARFVFDPGEERLRHAAAARRWTDVHPLRLGKVIEERDAAAPDRRTIDRRDEEPDVRLEDRLESKAVALLRRILGGERVLELGHERTDVVVGGADQAEIDGSHAPNVRGGAFPARFGCARRCYLFCGKPRSTPRKRGSGQRAVTTLLRV